MTERARSKVFMGVTLTSLAVLLALGAAGWLSPSVDTFNRTPAPPDSITNPMDPAQRAAVVEYARTLTFAQENPHEYQYHGQSDRNLLDTRGTIGTVTPEVNIHRTASEDLQRGRIQLRITVETLRDGMEAYDSLGVPPGVSYVWVDSRQVMGNDSGSARAVIIPIDTRFPVRAHRVEVHRGPDLNQPVARWTPEFSGEPKPKPRPRPTGQCWVCEAYGWCH